MYGFPVYFAVSGIYSLHPDAIPAAKILPSLQFSDTESHSSFPKKQSDLIFLEKSMKIETLKLFNDPFIRLRLTQ